MTRKKKTWSANDMCSQNISRKQLNFLPLFKLTFNKTNNL